MLWHRNIYVLLKRHYRGGEAAVAGLYCGSVMEGWAIRMLVTEDFQARRVLFAGYPYSCTDSTEVVFWGSCTRGCWAQHVALKKWLAATNGRRMSWSWEEKNSCKSFSLYRVWPGSVAWEISVWGVRAKKGTSELSTMNSASSWADWMLPKYLTSLVSLQNKLAWLTKPKMRWELMPENIYSSHLRENSRCFVSGGEWGRGPVNKAKS